MKRILITGATGFIGNSLVERLIKMGYEVIPVGRTLKPWSSDFIKKNLIKLDLTSNNLPDFGEIDCACLLGSIQPFKENKWDKYYGVNAKQVFHFLNKKIDQLIYISTTTVNAVNGVPNPLNYYGLSKALGERLLHINKDHFEQSSVLRFPSVMGVNHHGGIINDLKVWAEIDEEIILYDGGRKLRNIVHVNDAVSAIIRIIETIKKLSQYEVFEVGSKHSISLKEISESLIHFMGKDTKITLSDKSSNSKDIFVDNSNAISKLGYTPKTIEDGIKQYLKECNNEL